MSCGRWPNFSSPGSAATVRIMIWCGSRGIELSSPSTMMMSADDGVTSDSLMAILLRLRYESTSSPSDGSMTSTSAPWSANISPASRPLSKLAFSMMRTPSYGRRGAAAERERPCLSAAVHSAGAARRPSGADAARSTGRARRIADEARGCFTGICGLSGRSQL